MIKIKLSLIVNAKVSSLKKYINNGSEGYPDKLKYRAKLYPNAQDIKSPITFTELSPRYSPEVPVIKTHARWAQITKKIHYI